MLNITCSKNRRVSPHFPHQSPNLIIRLAKHASLFAVPKIIYIMFERPEGIENEKIWVDGCFDFAHHGTFEIRRFKHIYISIMNQNFPENPFFCQTNSKFRANTTQVMPGLCYRRVN